MVYTKGYLPIASTDNGAVELWPQQTPRTLSQRILRCLLVTSALLGLFLLGFGLGLRQMSATSNPTREFAAESSGELHYYMHFNGTFPSRPSEKSDNAWGSLFPEKLGFVQHPKLAPNVAGIAVFHELHCLNMLRQAFWASVDGTLAEMGAEKQEANSRTSHHHIRHCFEYLRQSLMCLADSNLEDMDYAARGVSGWQTERTCRNFEELRSWADTWGISKEEALQRFDLQANFASEKLGTTNSHK